MPEDTTDTRDDFEGDGRGPAQEVSARDEPAASERAEVSSYEIVRHWFALATDRLGVPRTWPTCCALPTAR